MLVFMKMDCMFAKVVYRMLQPLAFPTSNKLGDILASLEKDRHNLSG